MGQQIARNRYVDDGAGVVPQPRLLIMLYDRLVLDLEQAESAFPSNQFEAINNKLIHAQSIILALRSALDVDAWDGGPNLAELYLWFNDELVQANIFKDITRVTTVLRMIRELQSAWHQAYETILAERDGSSGTTTAIH